MSANQQPELFVNSGPKTKAAIIARVMSNTEASYLVRDYYNAQRDRIRAASQIRTIENMGTAVSDALYWRLESARVTERNIKGLLDHYTAAHPMGSWMRSIVGIGPVISAGLLAHLDIEKAEVAGAFWSFAGLDPSKKWEKGQKRPWNAELKTLCWKAGQSFIKFQNHEDCVYGHLFAERKKLEELRNERGDHAATAAQGLTFYGKETVAYKACLAGRLPQAQVVARASRWTVKIFLSHLHQVWYKQHFKKDPPLPYAIAILGHAHMIPAPNAVWDEADDVQAQVDEDGNEITEDTSTVAAPATTEFSKPPKKFVRKPAK